MKGKITEKGISAVIVTVMLLMITVSLVGVFYAFSLSTATGAASSASEQTSKTVSAIGGLIRITNIHGNNIEIQNIGVTDLSDFSVYLNDAKTEFDMDKPALKENEYAVITLKETPVGRYQVKVMAGLASDIWFYDFKGSPIGYEANIWFSGFSGHGSGGGYEVGIGMPPIGGMGNGGGYEVMLNAL